MATKAGCIDLLSVLASLDQRVRFDEVVAIGWSQALFDLPDEVLIPSAVAAARANRNGAMVTVGMVEEHAKPFMRRIARDVRSARIRGLVPREWPDNRPIPESAQEQLVREFEATNDYVEEIDRSHGPDLGQVGRNVA